MPRLPHESLPKKMGLLQQNAQKNVSIYGIFAVLILELLSNLLVDRQNYLVYFYPILTNAVIAVVLLQCVTAKYCVRKKIAYYTLTAYYLFNMIAIWFQFTDESYTQIVSYGLLGVTWILVFLTLKNKENV
jgi:hypothetical protein